MRKVGRPYAEIAEALGWSTQAVRVAVAKARDEGLFDDPPAPKAAVAVRRPAATAGPKNACAWCNDPRPGEVISSQPVGRVVIARLQCACKLERTWTRQEALR